MLMTMSWTWRNIVSLSFFKNPSGTRQERVREIQLGAHTVQSHGYEVAKFHRHDWIILLLLVVIEITLYVIHPFYRFVGKDMMDDLKYPLKDNTVPVWAVPMYAVLLPIAIFTTFYFHRRDVYDLHNSILGTIFLIFIINNTFLSVTIYNSQFGDANSARAGLLFSVLITGVITDAIKNAVGRPRPDFFWRCFPDGKDVYNELGNVICHGKASVIKEGHKSFPSGHTSWSFAGLGFLSLYLSGKIKAFDRRGHVAKLCILFLPLLAASLVGISRVDDYWHHWQDVFAGGILGLSVATFCYLQFFPPPYHTDGCRPYAYLRTLEELNGCEQPTNAVNTLNVHAVRVETVNQQVEQNNTEFMGLSRPNDSSMTLDELESGRR